VPAAVAAVATRLERAVNRKMPSHRTRMSSVVSIVSSLVVAANGVRHCCLKHGSHCFHCALSKSLSFCFVPLHLPPPWFAVPPVGFDLADDSKHLANSHLLDDDGLLWCCLWSAFCPNLLLVAIFFFFLAWHHSQLLPQSTMGLGLLPTSALSKAKDVTEFASDALGEQWTGMVNWTLNPQFAIPDFNARFFSNVLFRACPLPRQHSHFHRGKHQQSSKMGRVTNHRR